MKSLDLKSRNETLAWHLAWYWLRYCNDQPFEPLLPD